MSDVKYAIDALAVSLRHGGPIERAVFAGLKGEYDISPAVALWQCQRHILTIKMELEREENINDSE